jgi:hypothetical protein
MLRRVVWYKVIDVSEVLTAFIVRAMSLDDGGSNSDGGVGGGRWIDGWNWLKTMSSGGLMSAMLKLRVLLPQRY